MEPICNLKDIYKALYQFEREFHETHQITINEAMVLCCMKDGEMRSAGAICEFMGLSNSRLSKIITSVEEKNYISRNLNKEDKRQMLFLLTEEGTAKVQAMRKSDLNIQSLYSKLSEIIKME